MVNPEYRQHPEENNLDYAMRLIEIKRDLQPTDLSWADIVELLDLDLNPDSLRKSQDTQYGGLAVYKAMRKRIEQAIYADDFDIKKQELQKLKYEIIDERTALNKLIKEQAREDRLKQMAVECARVIKPFEPTAPLFGLDDENLGLVITLSDFHLGLEIEEYNNKYNSEIFSERLNKVLVCAINEIHANPDITNVFVVGLGDFIAGVIHNVIRIQSRETVIEQVVRASDAICAFLVELTKYVPKVEYLDCIGNHSRVFESKDDCLTKESFDILIHYIIAERLKDFNNIKINDYTINERMGQFVFNGHMYGFCHGDTFNINTLAKDFTMMTQNFYKAIFIGHIHHLYIEEQNGTLVIANGTLAGNDDYSNKLAKTSNPSQNMFLIGEEGVREIIPISLI